MPDHNFGLKLKELRERAGFTQPVLAQMAGLSKGGLADLEQGRYNPNWTTVRALAAALGVTADAFDEPLAATTQPRGRGRPPKVEAPPPKVKGKKK
jgi:DNA-binding XRE family transcriptional regulator